MSTHFNEKEGRRKEKRNLQQVSANTNSAAVNVTITQENNGFIGERENKKRRLTNGATSREAITEKVVEAPKKDNSNERRKRRKQYVVDNFESLPDEYRKYILRAGISESEAEKHLKVVLNILHFKTKYDFYTPDQIEKKDKVKVKRYNTGESKIADGIVSTASFEEEEINLLCNDFKKKNYKTVCQAGKGGFGKVYMVKSLKDKGQKVAVKRVPHVTVKQKRKNFQEIRFLKYCEKHQNIVKFLRAYMVKDEMWLVTEYMQGGTLTQAAAAHNFDESEVAYVAKQILQALDFLHENQLAHRDLKSANIMLDLSGNVKIIDFGLMSDISQGEVVHMVGSPFWMPPEMIKREPHGLSVDVWSFAICMMEIANGHPPNKKSSIKAMFAAGTTGYNSPLENRKQRWSSTFEDFLLRCLYIDPKKRCTVKDLLKHDFLKRAAAKEHMKGLFKNIFISNKLQLDGL